MFLLVRIFVRGTPDRALTTSWDLVWRSATAPSDEATVRLAGKHGTGILSTDALVSAGAVQEARSLSTWIERVGTATGDTWYVALDAFLPAGPSESRTGMPIVHWRCCKQSNSMRHASTHGGTPVMIMGNYPAWKT